MGVVDPHQPFLPARHTISRCLRTFWGQVARFTAQHGDLEFDEGRLRRLKLGLASHHAGMLPLEKALVEQLFQAPPSSREGGGGVLCARVVCWVVNVSVVVESDCLLSATFFRVTFFPLVLHFSLAIQANLLKAVFATETLAAGINMPARTTVITVLSKRGNNGIAPLTPSQLLQMSGRAGRRGLDELGNVLLCRSAFEGAQQAHALLLRPAGPIDSHFFVSYGSALKMLRQRSPNDCREIVSRSFGAFAARRGAHHLRARLAALRAHRASLGSLLAPHPAQSVEGYRKLEERLKAELRSLDYLEQRGVQAERELVETLLPFARTGTGVRLCVDGACAIVVDDAPVELKQRLGEESALLLQLADGSVRVAAARHIGALFPDEAPALPPESVARLHAALPPAPHWELLVDGSLRCECGAAPSLAALVPRNPAEAPSVATAAQAARVRSVETQIESHPLWAEPRRQEVLNSRRLDEGLADEERQLLRKIRRSSHVGENSGDNGWIADGVESAAEDLEEEPGSSEAWRQFLAVGTLLHEYGALESWEATEFGELIGSLSGENELWLAVVLMEAAATPLSAAQLAAVLSATLDERLRPNSFVAFSASPPVLQTLGELAADAASLEAAQIMHGLSFPVSLERGACALVEAWAAGESWATLMASTSLDSGDVYRLMRRTLELLKQVSLLPRASESATRRAREAVRAMDRYPISDDVSLGTALLTEAKSPVA